MKSVSRACLVALLVLLSGSASAGESTAIPSGKDFGAGITLERPVALAEVVQSPESFSQEPVLLHGRVADVCQHKGCWTVLRDGEAHVRVRFQDYGFFVPKDCVGEEAFVEGMVKVETLSEETARHYESESRDGDPDRVKGPQREVGFVASGVRLVGRE